MEERRKYWRKRKGVKEVEETEKTDGRGNERREKSYERGVR